MGSLKAMAYNTHLFGKVVGAIPDAVGWHDEDRFQSLKNCLKNADICGADVVSLEEIWSDDFVHTLEHDSINEQQYYPNSYKNYHHHGTALLSNPSGLMLLGNSRCVFNLDAAVYVDFIYEVEHGSEYDGFDPQDIVTAKGCYVVPATIEGTQQILIASTHMPTNSHEHPKSLQSCYQLLANTIAKLRGNSNCPVLLIGDFNLKETSSSIDFAGNPNFNRYNAWVGPNGILGQLGLRDVYRTKYPNATDSPGYSVVPSTNTCWRHFNSDAEGADGCGRIDYMMTIGLQLTGFPAGGMVRGTPPPATGSDYSDAANQWTWDDHGNRRDISDHYPIIAEFTY